MGPTENVSSAAGSPVYTLFEVEEPESLGADHLSRLAAGVLGAVRVRSFFTPEQCRDVVEALADCEMGSYDEQQVEPRIAKLGPTAYDFYADHVLHEQYWLEAKQAAKNRSGLLRGVDPMTVAIETLARVWGGPVRPATSKGQEMFAGIIREINAGARMHFDEIVREMLGALDEVPVAQLAFNCHLAVPGEGGEGVVFRRRWRPSDELHRDGYGYDPALTLDEPRVEVQADVGDAVFFDPRNYHLVKPILGGGRRTTLSFFIGMTGHGKLILWS